MSSGATKKDLNFPLVFARYFLALVFLSAGLFRIFFPELAAQELISLGLPQTLSSLIIIFEISAGLLLIFNKQTKYVYFSLLLFLSTALFWGLLIAGPEIILSLEELFIFNLTPTDWLLHLIFLIITTWLFCDVVKLIKK